MVGYGANSVVAGLSSTFGGREGRVDVIGSGLEKYYDATGVDQDLRAWGHGALLVSNISSGFANATANWGTIKAFLTTSKAFVQQSLASFQQLLHSGKSIREIAKIDDIKALIRRAESAISNTTDLKGPWELIDRFRRAKGGLQELGDVIPVRGDGLGTVAYVEAGGRRVFGVNSTSLVRDVDKNLARTWRTKLGFNAGQAQALFHAEAHSLMRAYEKLNGAMPKNITMYVDRLTCGPCQSALPDLIKSMGIETLTIQTKSGRVGEITGGIFKWTN